MPEAISIYKILLVMIFFVGVIKIEGQADRPKFASTLTVLETEQIELGASTTPRLFYYEISSTGRYVAARNIEYHADNSPYQSSLYLWEIQEQTTTIPYLQAQQIYQLSEPSYPQFAISPSEHYLAVEAANEIRILSLPELEQLASIPVEFSLGGHSIRWNPEEDVLAIVDGRNLLIWSAQDNQIMRQDFSENQPFGGLIATKIGWWQQSHDWDSFRFCTVLLDACNTYEFADTNGPMSVSQSGQYLITERGHPAAETGVEIAVWEHQSEANFSFRMLEPEMNPPFWYLWGFSTTDRYIASGTHLIWDWQSQTVVNELTALEGILWLPDDNYFISANPLGSPSFTLKLYEFGHNEAFNTFSLSDNPELAWIEEIITDYSLYDIGENAQVSRDGRFVLIDLVWLALILPIERS